MRPLAVLAEALAVISRDHHQGAIELTGRAQIVEQLPDHRVGVRHLGVVRLVPRGERFRGAVGFMRVIQMDPSKPGLRAEG